MSIVLTRWFLSWPLMSILQQLLRIRCPHLEMDDNGGETRQLVLDNV